MRIVDAVVLAYQPPDTIHLPGTAVLWLAGSGKQAPQAGTLCAEGPLTSVDQSAAERCGHASWQSRSSVYLHSFFFLSNVSMSSPFIFLFETFQVFASPSFMSAIKSNITTWNHTQNSCHQSACKVSLVIHKKHIQQLLSSTWVSDTLLSFNTMQVLVVSGTQKLKLGTCTESAKHATDDVMND